MTSGSLYAGNFLEDFELEKNPFTNLSKQAVVTNNEEKCS